jgi:hypothetical protein
VFVVLDVLRDGLSAVVPRALAEVVVLGCVTLVTAAASAALMATPRPTSRLLAVCVEALAAALVLILNSGPLVLTWWWGDAIWAVETGLLDAVRDRLTPIIGRLTSLFLSTGYAIVAMIAASYVRRLAPERSSSFANHFQRSLVWTAAMSLISTGLFALWWLHASGADRLSGSGGLRPVVLGLVGVWLVGLLIALFLTLVGWIIESRAERLRAATIATVVVALLTLLLLATDILPRAWNRDAAAMLLASLVGAWLWLFRDFASVGLSRLGFRPKHRTGPPG